MSPPSPVPGFGEAGYTEHHPKWLRTRVSTYWWLKRGSYFMFIMRELSSIFVAWFAVYLLLLVRAVSQGDSQYREFVQWSASPVVLVLNIITLAFILLHAVTWFNLAPQAMVVNVGKTRVPPVIIAGSNYAAWVVVSAVLAWLLLQR